MLAGIFGVIFVLGILIYMLKLRWRKNATEAKERKGITTMD